MNKNALIGLAVVIVLILAGLGGYMVLSNRSSSSNQDEAMMQDDQNTSTPTGNSMQSLKDLFTSGASQKCTFSITDNNSGTVYISNGQVRGDIITTSNQTTINSHMIVKDNTLYSWIEGQTTGFKMAFNPEKTPSSDQDQSTTNQDVDVNQKYDYNCSPWSVDSSQFVLPTGINFTDTSSMMMQNSTSAPKLDCSTCDALTGSSKTACLTALKCN